MYVQRRSTPSDFFPRDRRPKPRVDLRLPVRLRYEQLLDLVEAATVNISESGMLIQTGTIRPVGARFELSITSADGIQLIVGVGEVVWSSLNEKGASVSTGVRFLYLAASQSLELMRRMVAAQRRDQSRRGPSTTQFVSY